MIGSVLQRPALILNRNWQAVAVATVARSLVMLSNGAARAVDPADYQTYGWDEWLSREPSDGEGFVQAVRMRVCVPEVLTLTYYDRVPVGAVAFSRRNLYRRDRYTCQYCGARPARNELSIDHIVPKSRGGGSSWANCVVACVSCNKNKADRLPHEARMRLRTKPIRPKWSPYLLSVGVQVESWARFLG